MSMRLFVDAVGICADGMPDWGAARAVLRGEAAFDAALPVRLVASALPATERRRANETSRWALQAASQAVAGLDPACVAALPTVFASADGDGDVLAQVLHDLAAEKVALSPTTFHNSVFNAPAGYWSIAAHAPAASTTICADAGSFAAGLLESAGQVAATGAAVMLVVYDLPFPARSPISTGSRAAFACALLLAPQPGSSTVGSIDDMSLVAAALPAPLYGVAARFAGNAAAAALALLDPIACVRAARVVLPYDEAQRMELAWTPIG